MKLATALIGSLLLSASAWAATDAHHPKQLNWAFDGNMGAVDDVSVQRGFQVYKEVCAACHGVKRLAFRNLTDVGFSDAEVKALAASYEVTDGPNDEGDMFQRPGRPSDKLPSPYANEQQARSLNNGAYPPDLSLIIKARHDGANYLYSLLTGYKNPPKDVELLEGQHYNPYFPGGKLAMPAPFSDDQITYMDGTKATKEQMAKDVVNFLQWVAEPEMEHRKSMGLKVTAFLAVMTVIFYLTKRRIWKDVH
jgi:ubiquinol-cytochrome c reductase cytochrome c1 subunit